MTPLEELQAAHKRLSELSSGHNNGHPWMQLRDHAGIESSCADGPHFIADATDETTADLIVALHRTIDAQLKVLERGIAREHVKWGADSPVLDLARAINGEAS